MVDNKGNAYRTRQSIIVFCTLIGLVLALLAWAAAGLSAACAAGIFLIVTGAAVAAAGASFSGTPDKFGPSEQLYRIAAGLVMAIVGAVLAMTEVDLEWYVYVAVLIVGVAVVGLAVTMVSSRKIGNE